MTENQKKFVELEKQKEQVKAYFEQLKEAVENVAKEVGINGYFQDEEGTVYKVVEPEGKFVTYDKISYVRTRRANEKRGDLSLKEAEEAGFNVPSKS
jgi:uncharacterized protein YnzC (UPF0291/DUF896 family)